MFTDYIIREISEHGRMFMKKGHLSDCANCGLTAEQKACMNPKGKGAKGCPTITKKKLAGQAKKEYQAVQGERICP